MALLLGWKEFGGEKWLTMGQEPLEGCGHRKMRKAIVKLWPSREGLRMVGWRVINVFLSSHPLISCWCLLLPRPSWKPGEEGGREPGDEAPRRKHPRAQSRGGKGGAWSWRGKWIKACTSAVRDRPWLRSSTPSATTISVVFSSPAAKVVYD